MKATIKLPTGSSLDVSLRVVQLANGATINIALHSPLFPNATIVILDREAAAALAADLMIAIHGNDSQESNR